MRGKGLVVVAVAAVLAAPARSHADGAVGTILAAPPPIVVAAPPRLVIVPGSTVYYAPAAGYNLFVYAGHYYSFHDGVWFYAQNGKGRWTAVRTEYVPRAVLAVPASYYKVPPAQVKKVTERRGSEDRPGQGRGRGR